MVDVGVGQQDKIQGIRRKAWKLPVVGLSLSTSLEHAAIDKKFQV